MRCAKSKVGGIEAMKGKVAEVIFKDQAEQ